MSKQPYIPLYIGDWTQDTDALSIEAEGAWLRIIFKCWRNEGSFTATEEILARVCKMSEQKFATVLLEWEICNTCEIERRPNGLLTLRSRRITEDVKISAIRKQIGSKGGSKTQANRVANTEQKPEYVYDNVIDNDTVVKKGVQGETDILSDESLALIFDEATMDGYRMAFREHNITDQLNKFKVKIRGAPDDYKNRDTGGIRNAFQYHLSTTKPEKHGNNFKKTNGTTSAQVSGTQYSGSKL
jgi:uncharacterized protein YdaU (DUF1376 family)